ncbi:HPr-rel-A system PqqD family peptide chaperone [Paucibacter sp. R3-3]|uniref:HPr-rel-A system PqqD family peptide chaperone n=1 Tax=Roseateles agri TaxID=3098619 RepID=A0ABU5DLT8_9BURK|nr:HPr-rel-A system PqqD family peptide chaperone [Paucibacter sp. R3-3]MDY0747261.1 HPr-rel-A system PqqD family peptide chaperone [Paucibacter sp. R3-3]
MAWRDWDDGLSAVYDDASGDTHVLDALAMELLELLMRQALSIPELAVELADAVPDDMDQATVHSFLERQLQSLLGLGLIEQLVAPA